MTPDEIAQMIDCITTDWNGDRMVDGEPPRIVPPCGELRAIAAAIRAERARAEKAELTLQIYASDLTTAQLDADREHERAEAAEAERDRLRDALAKVTQEPINE